MSIASGLLKLLDAVSEDITPSLASKQADLNDCTFFDLATGSCRSGCVAENVAAGDICPFIDYQRDCDCYST